MSFTYTASDASGAGSNNIATYSFLVDNRPLPVELVSFVAKMLNQVDAQLSWRTASEKNNERFDIERSADGRSFVRIAQAQLQAIDQDLAAVVAAEPELRRKLQHLTNVPGIGLTTAIVLVAETNGFSLVTNEWQFASYAGLGAKGARSTPELRVAARVVRRVGRGTAA